MASTSTQEPDEEAFTFVRSRRRPRPTAAGKTVSSSTGLTGRTSGFAYASTTSHADRAPHSRQNRRKGGKTQERLQEEQLERAQHAVDTFVRYLGSELRRPAGNGKGKGREGRKRSYAEELGETVRAVWGLSEKSGDGPAGLLAESTASVSSEEDAAPAQAAAAPAPAPPATTSPTSSAPPPAGDPERGLAAAEQAKAGASPPPPPQRIVCLGLGSPLTSRSAQIQLALLVVLRAYLLTLTPTLADEHGCSEGTGGTVSTEDRTGEGDIECVAYDPVFTRQDVGLLARYGVRVASSAHSAPDHSDTTPLPPATVPQHSAPPLAHETPTTPPPIKGESIESHYTQIRAPTLLYMPHCDRELYEHVLALNPDFKGITLLSNWLANYSLHHSGLASSCPSLARAVERFRVRELPNWEPGKKALPLRRDRGPDEAKETGSKDGEEAEEEQGQAALVAEFARLWDRNALRDLGFHWL